MKWWLTLYLVAQALDMGTTALKIQQGCHEGLWPNAPLMYTGKSAGIVVTVALSRTHPTTATVLSGIGIASGTYGAIHNLRTTCR